MNAKTVAAIFGCTEAQAKAQYAKNAAQLSSMAAKAHRTGRKINGCTERQLSRWAMQQAQQAKPDMHLTALIG